MSEHKTGLSNWTADEKRLYRKRRNKSLRGQLESSVIQKTSSTFSRGKHSAGRATIRQQRQAFVRMQRKATSRGE